MTHTESIYRAILLKISRLPTSYLQRVDAYLHLVMQESKRDKQENRKKILALAGGWDDMSETTFQEYLEETRKTARDMFQDRDISL